MLFSVWRGHAGLQLVEIGGAGKSLESSPDLKSNLNMWDRFPASTVMSPVVCPVLECKVAREIEISKHQNPSMASITLQNTKNREKRVWS